MTVGRKLLEEQHASLLEGAEALRNAVSETAPDMGLLARAKWQLGYRLAAHLALEDRFVYPLLKAHADARVAALAARYQKEMGDLNQRFRDYLAHWSANRVAAEWDAYASDTLTVLDALEKRIAREELELYPLAQSANQRMSE